MNLRALLVDLEIALYGASSRETSVARMWARERELERVIYAQSQI